MAVLLSGAALIGGGTASAADAHNGHHGDKRAAHHWHHHHHNGLARKASELGVTTDQLKSAITAAKASTAKGDKDAFVAAVAQSLNLPADKVAAAFSCKHDAD